MNEWTNKQTKIPMKTWQKNCVHFTNTRISRSDPFVVMKTSITIENGYITLYTSITAHNGPLRTKPPYHFSSVHYILCWVIAFFHVRFLVSFMHSQWTHIPPALTVVQSQFLSGSTDSISESWLSVCVCAYVRKPNKLREREKEKSGHASVGY